MAVFNIDDERDVKIAFNDYGRDRLNLSTDEILTVTADIEKAVFGAFFKDLPSPECKVMYADYDVEIISIKDDALTMVIECQKAEGWCTKSMMLTLDLATPFSYTSVTDDVAVLLSAKNYEEVNDSIMELTEDTAYKHMRWTVLDRILENAYAQAKDNFIVVYDSGVYDVRNCSMDLIHVIYSTEKPADYCELYSTFNGDAIIRFDSETIYITVWENTMNCETFEDDLNNEDNFQVIKIEESDIGEQES